MSQRKRSVDDELVDENNNNKKFKSTFVSSKSHFESLANEIIFEIFEYLDAYEIYHSFYNYNLRFRNLIVNSNSLIQVYIGNISKNDFSIYASDFIHPHKARINYLHLTNPFTFNELFHPPRLIGQFVQLETLILKDTNIRFLSHSFQHLARLKHLHTLHISFANTIEYVHEIYRYIFQLPVLKTLNLTYRTTKYHCPSPIRFSSFDQSPIENLTIQTRFRFDSLSDLFTRVPHLRYLSIDCLVGTDQSTLDPSIVVLKYLKHVSIKFDGLSFLHLIKLTEMYFISVEHFNITIRNTWKKPFLPVNLWQNLIEQFMPNLKRFDLNIRENLIENANLINSTIDNFDESFWTMRKWSFSHQVFQRNQYDARLMLYSTNPYRRKDFTLYWNTCEQTARIPSVEYLKIYGTQATDLSIYFPNVKKLKIGNYFTKSNTHRSFIDTFNQLFPLKQLESLEILDWNMPIEELFNLIHILPKLHTLKLYVLMVFNLNLTLIEQHPMIQSIIRTNQIKTFDLTETCSLTTLKFILKLFPKIEHLTIGMNSRDIDGILRELFTNRNPHLKFLCFTQTPQRCLKEVDFFLKSNDLLQNYSIKLYNRQLFLWW